jgi:hypothetical protein
MTQITLKNDNNTCPKNRIKIHAKHYLFFTIRFAVCAQIIAGEPKLEANYMIKNTKASRKKIQTPNLKRIVGAADREFKDTYFNGI